MGTVLQEQLIQFQHQFWLLNSAVSINWEKSHNFWVEVGAQYLPCNIYFNFFSWELEWSLASNSKNQLFA